MQDQAQILIIGGGIVGCSLAYHLTKMGRRDVMLLDKAELTSGGYGHTVGRSIAFAYLPVEEARRAGGFEIEAFRELYPVTLQPERQLVDPQREKLLG